MSWSSFNPSAWVNGTTIPQTSDFQGIYADLRTRGGNVDGGHYGRSNSSYLTLVPGDLPGTSYSVTAASWASSVATLTIGVHNIQVGQRVNVTSITPTGYNTADSAVTAVTGTQIKFAVTSNPGAYSSGGTVLVGLSAAANGMIACNPIGQLEVYAGGWLPIGQTAGNINLGALGVGLTTQTPTAQLQVQSSAADSQVYVSDTAPRIALGNNVTYASRTQAVRFVMATSGGQFGLPNAGDAWVFTEGAGGGTAGDLHLGTLARVSQMILQASTGFVGIGMSPSHLLQLAADDAAKPSTNTWTIASDQRLKENVVDFTDGLARICAIRPVAYSYNGLAGTPKGVQGIGVIAQEAEAAVPYCVGHSRAKLNPDDLQDVEVLTFNSHALTYLMVNAFKELDARLKAIESRA